MSALDFSSPLALLMLLAIPLIWAAHLVARTSFNRPQRMVQAAVRSLIVAALAFAVARPVLVSSSTRTSFVYLVDVSHSVAPAAIEEAARTIDAMDGHLQPDHSRVVAFARAAVPIDRAALAAIARGEENAAPGLDRSGTDLEAALFAARGELAPQHVPQIVVFTDGRATLGDTSEAVVRLASEGIPVSVVPFPARAIADTWVESIDLPERVPAGTPFGAVVRLGSGRGTPATVTLRSGGTVLASRDAAVGSGTTVVSLEATLRDPGAHRIETVVAVQGDPLSANNTLAGEVWATPPSQVLYLEGTPESARYLAGALDAAGFAVTVRPPSGMPGTADELEPFDVVILSDVGRSAIPPAAMEALSDWVENKGGGLLVAGGEAVYGDRGYKDTAIERLTPVTFERRDEPEIALVLVLDRSWSMAGASMELTKAAAQAAVDVLGDEQSIGILTFNDKFDWDVPIRNVGAHREEIRQRIAAIGPGGHTLIYPAVEQAYLALRNARARVRHVILLSDGRSYPGEYESLLRKMVEARITVSTVAVGPSADPDLLRDLAQWGNGRAYVVADASQVPEIFVKEAKNAATPAFDEKPIVPVVKTPGFLTGVDLTRIPRLRGRTATVLKDGALELMATDEGDPLLAFWPAGLGRTAVFTSDVKDRWAADWVRWAGYGPFFASIVRALERQRPPAFSLELRPGPIRATTRAVVAAIEARGPDGSYRDLLNPALEVQQPGAGATAVPARQVAPGRYEATILAPAAHPLTVAVAGADPAGAGVTARTILPDPAAEYRFREPDDDLLRSIASATRGVWGASPESLATTGAETRQERRALWPALLALALALWFVDLLLRRIRVFEPRVRAAAHA